MRPWLKILLLVTALVVSAVVGKIALGQHFELSSLIATLRGLSSDALALPLYFLIFGTATSLFAPAGMMMIAAGVTWGFWPGCVVVWVTCNVWVHVHFWVGRRLTGDAFKAWLAQRGAAWLLRELEQGGVLTTVLVRHLPLPFLLVNLAGGASPISFRHWVWGNAIGLVPNCLVYTQLAAALADGIEGARQTAIYRVVFAAAVMLGVGLLTRKFQRRN